MSRVDHSKTSLGADEALYRRISALPRRDRDQEFSFRWHELWWCLWHVLTYEHDGMEDDAAAARRNADEFARSLREYIDPLDGREASEIMVAWAWEMARVGLRANLQWEAEQLARCHSAEQEQQVKERGWRSVRGKRQWYRRSQTLGRLPIG